ncbi:MAG: FAD-dependent oxidoreductase [Alphaproteobacteria bacterium]|nr:FAD-dependent oxidoreductase [Alphaproteobacteria bacterium]
MTQNYDIILFGGGIAGLFIASRLQRAGYNLILIEKDSLGGVQTIASQGMVHGGQKYTLQGMVTKQAENISKMPERWDACFEGWGEVDLSSTKFLSDSQVMFSAGTSFISSMTVFAASKALNGKTMKLKHEWLPDVLKDRKKFRGPVYEMQEKVLEIKSLVASLAGHLKGRLLKGEPQEMLPDGHVAVEGVALKAKAIIFTAGVGNETALRLMKIEEQHTQRRPLRQIMVKSMPYALYGHGIVGNPKPRVTITSHPIGKDEFVWYLGGNVAEKGAEISEVEALQFAKKEMKEIFPAIDWENREWASWYGDRAEPFDPEGNLPPGPCVQQRGRVLIAWPTKMTLVPVLSDNIFDWLKRGGVTPSPVTAPPCLPEVEIGLYPWELAVWQRI